MEYNDSSIAGQHIPHRIDSGIPITLQLVISTHHLVINIKAQQLLTPSAFSSNYTYVDDRYCQLRHNLETVSIFPFFFALFNYSFLFNYNTNICRVIFFSLFFNASTERLIGNFFPRLMWHKIQLLSYVLLVPLFFVIVVGVSYAFPLVIIKILIFVIKLIMDFMFRREIEQ